MAKKHRKESLDALFREKVLLEMLKIAGVGMWTYSTETGRLRYIGFADTIHRHDELQYVDPADYLKLMNGEDLQTVTQFMADIHAGRPPQEGIRYKIHGNGEDFYLENHVVTCQPLGNGFYYLKGYVKNITAQVMEANRLCIEKERTEQADRLRSAFFAHVSRELRGPLNRIEELALQMVHAESVEEREECFHRIQENRRMAMKIADVDGVKIAGVLFEAGEKESDTLLEVGAKKSDVSHGANPTTLSDVYFRVGGSSYEGKVENCITVNSNDVIGDNLWVWRADHGDNVAWDKNTAKNGAVIHGDNVIMYGLFVEHFQEYQTIWDGNGGRLYFYQSEIPYDVPNQSEFMSNNGKVNGFASLKVGDNVLTFESYGVGVYSYNRDATITIDRAVEVPDIEGVKLHNTVTVMLNGHPGIEHVINNSGYGVKSSGATARIVEYENGEQNNMVSRNLE